MSYKCKICDNPLAKIAYIALIKYRDPETIPIESVVEALRERNFVCDNLECKLEISDLLSEGYRDRDTFLLPLKKELLYSNNILSDLGKGMIAKFIDDYEKALLRSKQTNQDKSIAKELSQ